MAIKKLKLTEDHLRLISAIKFSEFDFSERFSTNQIVDALDKIEDVLFDKHNTLKGELATRLANLSDYLNGAKRKLDILSEDRGHYGWGIDQYSLFGGTFVFEDIALIIGKYDQIIPGTKDDPQGADFPPELKDYMWKLYRDIVENMTYIISLVLFYSTRGGLTPGTYKCIDYEMNWEKVE